MKMQLSDPDPEYSVHAPHGGQDAGNAPKALPSRYQRDATVQVYVYTIVCTPCQFRLLIEAETPRWPCATVGSSDETPSESFASTSCLIFTIRGYHSFPPPPWPLLAPRHSFATVPRRIDFDAHDLRTLTERTTSPLSAEIPRLRMAFTLSNGGGAFTSSTPDSGASARIGEELQEIQTEVCRQPGYGSLRLRY